jgi:hypothetical protein
VQVERQGCEPCESDAAGHRRERARSAQESGPE